MKRFAILAGITAFTIVGAASADVTLTLTAKGYDDFFKRCDFKITTENSADIDQVAVHFHVPIAGKGAEICRSIPSQRSCQNADDFKYTCDDLSRVDILNVQCTSGDGAEVPCGKLSVAASVGTKAKAVLPELTGTNDAATKIFPIIAGDDSFFNNCKVGMGVSAPKDATVAKIDYRMVIGTRGEFRCTSSTSNGIGTGVGCASSEPLDHTCSDVTAVFIDSIVCEDNDGATKDCGNASVRASDPGLFIDNLK